MLPILHQPDCAMNPCRCFSRQRTGLPLAGGTAGPGIEAGGAAVALDPDHAPARGGVVAAATPGAPPSGVTETGRLPVLPPAVTGGVMTIMPMETAGLITVAAMAVGMTITQTAGMESRWNTRTIAGHVWAGGE